MTELVKIPGYKIESVLGYGGMSTVYLAEQESLGRRVALKVMAESLTHDPTYTKRFLKEARIIAQLSFPHIIVIYDYGVVDGQHYIAMECIGGGDLFRRVKTHMDVSEVINITIQVARALAYAHGKGYIHRDIKPGNILFREDGGVVLSDFGLAKGLSDNTQVTAAGMTLGTPAYMSPEQAFGEQVDSRSDLYSLGCVFYFMLTGAKPYTADNPVALAMKHLRDPVPTLPKEYVWLQPVLDKLMAKKPEDRYQYGEDLAKELEQYSDEDSVTPVKPSLLNRGGAADESSELHLQQFESLTPEKVVNAVDGFAGNASRKPPVGSPALELVDDSAHAPSAGDGFSSQATQVLKSSEMLDGRRYLKNKSEPGAPVIKVDEGIEATLVMPSAAQPVHSLPPAGSEAGDFIRERSRGEIPSVSMRQPPKKPPVSKLLIAAIGAAIIITVVNVGVGIYLAQQRNIPSVSKIDEQTLLDESRWSTPTRKLIRFSDPLTSGGTGPEMVVVAKGSFEMGDLSGRYGPSARPVHSVNLATDFAMGVNEVSFDDYDKFTQATNRARADDRQWGRGTRPAIYVSWQDATDYAAWLSSQTSKRYRLPTEAEWEYASRAGSSTDYWWGDWPNHEFANFGSEVCCRGQTAGADQWGEETSPVGSFSVNDYGLHDSLGNVWEWVQDCWNVDHYGASASGTVRRDGDCAKRVVRGGSWSDIPRNIAAAARGRAPVDKKLAFIGFRVVREQ